DLEKELTCSICTDLLYQPLTLLDCLHTFCGACLKEWFAFQASTATSLHPYTCPSCRASVRSTQPNATVTTLLDMFIQANPARGKSEEDKRADREKFKYGENVLPRLRRRGGGEGDEVERRTVEDVQALSLRERRRRERSRDGRSRSGSEDTRRDRDEGRSMNHNVPSVSASRESVPPRVVEHQSSLRSLLSASDLDSQEMEEEIVRQIMEEGLLDGIDLNNIDVAQEDEISERIAQAYRQRRTQRHRERRERRERLAREGNINSGYSTPTEVRSPPIRDDEQQRRRTHGRSESGRSTPRERERDNRPPISRPGLLDVANQGARARHTRSSSQGSSRSARSDLRPAPLAVSSRHNHSVSQTDISTQPVSAPLDGRNPARRRQSDSQQHSTLAERQQIGSSPQTSSSNPDTSNISIPATESATSTTAVVASPLSSPPAASQPTSSSRRTTDPGGVRQLRRTNSITPPSITPPTMPRSITDPSTIETQARISTATAASVIPTTLYPEPHISCSSCGKDHIEHDLHYNCPHCDSGAYSLCQPCYRGGKGCKHWFGFGWAAWPAYQRKSPPGPGGYTAEQEYPHVMRGRRWRNPKGQLTEGAQDSSTPGTLMSEEEPSQRLEEGVFCDICSKWADTCYWKCDYCNEGEWGYCNHCVNSGLHCTHPLLALTHVTEETSNPTNPPYPDDSPPQTPKRTSPTMALANSLYHPETFTVLCNICRYPIPPSHSRFHCPQCNDGDYDICTSCYKKAGAVGKISESNGINGWRRCLRGHRMIIVGFEDRDGGRRRVVVRDLVGGLALREEEATSIPAESSTPTTLTPTPHRRYPPDGGMGLRIQARWSYFPSLEAKDELGFPRFAEITEAEDINGDWFWGVYAGRKGLFP
ncbi:hypothetical protein P280DRAFT_374629, partial [Massarina eburnea CBS 473.64]